MSMKTMGVPGLGGMMMPTMARVDQTVLDRLEALEAKADKTEDNDTPGIDSTEELSRFTEGYTNDQKLKDIIPQAMTEEELTEIKGLIK